MYSIKKNVELPKEFKVKVNPEQSKALQEFLFTIGINWAYGSYVDHLEMPYLYVRGNRITWGCEPTFEDKIMIKLQDYFESLEEFGIEQISNDLGGGEAFSEDSDMVIKVDRPNPEWQMSKEAQIVFNILYKKGIKFDCHDFEVYLKIFQEGQNHKK